MGEKERHLPKEVPAYPNKGEISSNVCYIYCLGTFKKLEFDWSSRNEII